MRKWRYCAGLNGHNFEIGSSSRHLLQLHAHPTETGTRQHHTEMMLCLLHVRALALCDVIAWQRKLIISNSHFEWALKPSQLVLARRSLSTSARPVACVRTVASPNEDYLY